MKFNPSIAALMMLVQASYAAPQSSSNGANSSRSTTQSLANFSSGSTAYNNVDGLYNQINQIMSSSNSQPSSNSETGYIQNNMNHTGNQHFRGYHKGEPATSDQSVQSAQPTQYAQSPQPPAQQTQTSVVIQTPPPAPPAQTASSVPQPSGSSSQFDANAFLQLVNEFRSQNGAGPVNLANALNEAAAQHNGYMISISTLTHSRAPGQDLETMIEQYGGTSGGNLGECVAEGYLTTQDVFNGWKNDAPHAAIMKDPGYTQMGVALNGSYSTAEFSN
jgi:uncharacterized protein YkwD